MHSVEPSPFARTRPKTARPRLSTGIRHGRRGIQDRAHAREFVVFQTWGIQQSLQHRRREMHVGDLIRFDRLQDQRRDERATHVVSPALPVQAEILVAPARMEEGHHRQLSAIACRAELNRRDLGEARLAALRSDNALWPARRAARIHDERRIIGSRPTSRPLSGAHRDQILVALSPVRRWVQTDKPPDFEARANAGDCLRTLALEDQHSRIAILQDIS